MRGLLALSRLIDTINERIGLFVSWALLLAVFICTGNALVRYVLHVGSNAWLEIQWYLFSAVFLLAASYTLKRNEHVRVDIISGKLSAKVRATIDVIGFLLFVIPMCLIIIQYAIPYFAESFSKQEISMNAGGLIIWPVKLLIPVSFFALLCQAISEIIKRIAFISGVTDESPFERAGGAHDGNVIQENLSGSGLQQDAKA
jgi:TRAP-type mannitol/chloroaromatic compound transport system permease small subunit